MIEVPIKEQNFSITYDYKGDIARITFKNKITLKELINLLTEHYERV